MPVSFNANDPYEQLITQTIRLERAPQQRLEQQRSQQQRFKKVLGDFDSKLSALHGRLKSFTDAFSNPFAGRAAQTSAESFGVSASADAATGSHTLQVERLASADVRISERLQAGGTSLRSFFDAQGAQTFSIDVAHPTADDPAARTSISVTVDPAGATDEEILQQIDGAIGAAMDAAVDAGTLKRSERAQASVVNETTGTARLSLRSGQTGYANRLAFTDSAGGLLSRLQITNDAVAEGAGGGQVNAVGTNETDSSLNSKFTLDGLTLYRSTNRVDDAVDGLTLTLNEAGAPAAAFNVAPDAEGIKGEVSSFIEQYNGVLKFIEDKAKVDGETGERGDFAGERTITGLRFGMRSDVARAVPGPAGSDLRTLTDLGLSVERDGTLSLDDEDALLAAVEKDPDAVRRLFAGDEEAGTEGIATRLLGRVERFTSTGGFIDNREKSIDEGVRRLDTRISDWDDRLSSRENQLRNQYAQLQETIAALEGQQRSISSFFGFY